MIMTKKGSLMPKVFLGSPGHMMYVVLKQRVDGCMLKDSRESGKVLKLKTQAHLTFLPSTSSTSEWMSLSVILLMWPFSTCDTRVSGHLKRKRKKKVLHFEHHW